MKRKHLKNIAMYLKSLYLNPNLVSGPTGAIYAWSEVTVEFAYYLHYEKRTQKYIAELEALTKEIQAYSDAAEARRGNKEG